MNKQLFNNESEMQKWLSDTLKQTDDLKEIIVNVDELDQYSSTNMGDKKVLESFMYCLESLDMVEVVSENENISFSPKDSLKPDFVLYAPETESIVIIELKNIVSPARQAGTEISAYANEIKSYVPFISDGDIVNIIISSVWPTLLRHYVFHEIFWQQRNILCLEPVDDNGAIKLRIVDVKKIAEDTVTLKLSPLHLGGYQICLYDDNLYKEPENFDRLDMYILQMKTAMTAMASKGNSQKNHGFAFLCKDKLRGISLAPYSITIINISSFQSFERHFHDANFEPNAMAKKIIEDIIVQHAPMGHGNSLNAITIRGKKFLENFCKPREEGFQNWDTLKEILLRRGILISFHCWGVFEEIYTEKLFKEYDSGRIDIGADSPQLGLDILNELIDSNYEYIDLSYDTEELDEEEEED